MISKYKKLAGLGIAFVLLFGIAIFWQFYHVGISDLTEIPLVQKSFEREDFDNGTSRVSAEYEGRIIVSGTLTDLGDDWGITIQLNPASQARLPLIEGIGPISSLSIARTPELLKSVQKRAPATLEITRVTIHVAPAGNSGIDATVSRVLD